MRVPGAACASMNCRHAGIRRAGLAPISCMSAKWTCPASPPSSDLTSPIFWRSRATTIGSSASSAPWMNGMTPARNCSSSRIEKRVVPEDLLGAQGAQAAADRCEPTPEACVRSPPAASRTTRSRGTSCLRPGRRGIPVLKLRWPERGPRHASKGWGSVRMSDGQPSQVDGLELRLPANADQIPVARRAVADFCELYGLPAPLVDDVKLVVTEACTNVVLHAYEGVRAHAHVRGARARRARRAPSHASATRAEGSARRARTAGSASACASPCSLPEGCRRARAPAASGRASRCASPCRTSHARAMPSLVHRRPARRVARARGENADGREPRPPRGQRTRLREEHAGTGEVRRTSGPVR